MEALARRRFIQLLGGAAGTGVLPLNFRCIGGGAHIVGSTYLPTPDRPLTPTEQFYININFGRPAVPADPAAWRLYVRGMVDRPLALGLADLARLEQVTREVTVECIGNPPGGGLISSAAFTGVRTGDVLAAAGLDAHARGIAFVGLDGWTVLLPVDVTHGDDSLLVTAMNGEALTPDHGAPVRALHRGRHGLFSVKWLDSLAATRDYQTWGALRGLANFVDGTTAVRSRIDAVGDGRTVVRGEPVEVTGLAMTPGTGVAGVDVFADGVWAPAALSFNTVAAPRGPYLWSLWRFAWTPAAAGAQTLRVRAVDNQGATQHTDPRFPYDSGAVHALHVVVVER